MAGHPATRHGFASRRKQLVVVVCSTPCWYVHYVMKFIVKKSVLTIELSLLANNVLKRNLQKHHPRIHCSPTLLLLEASPNELVQSSSTVKKDYYNIHTISPKEWADIDTSLLAVVKIQAKRRWNRVISVGVWYSLSLHPGQDGFFNNYSYQK